MDIRDRAEGVKIWAGSFVLRNEEWQSAVNTVMKSGARKNEFL
jgi:hypothetical protein